MRLVDLGWHTFLLDTMAYHVFCQRVASRFIHHVPDTDGDARVSVSRTAQVIAAAGWQVDRELWDCADAADLTKCSQCHAGCHDSPTGGR
ncbi:hypothetical protein GCM10010124_08020 [Pilimelia terevasa]|uniref:Uncharacterized protein n=1 Tax=Pilimelia terevasa TaxID=53372 RepID=A0A8J3BIT7_9ACTN|nr:hypothetical protein [Pilimelia terevasa]GGK17851.1 hypothetical protein GCM10010124_08020 [Pilimelia terevasa]